MRYRLGCDGWVDFRGIVTKHHPRGESFVTFCWQRGVDPRATYQTMVDALSFGPSS